jgi:hypothetical protein
VWVNLAYFQTVASSEVYKVMDQNAKDFGPPMVVDKAVDAFSCWYNVKDVLHRLFLLTPVFAAKWDAVVVDLQRLILRRQESLPLLAAHGIVFELLNSLLARGFFHQVCRPEVTVDQVEAAVSDLYVEPDSEWFRTIYAVAERRLTLSAPNRRRSRKVVRKPSSHDPSLGKRRVSRSLLVSLIFPPRVARRQAVHLVTSQLPMPKRIESDDFFFWST